jgi:hypothetical protein
MNTTKLLATSLCAGLAACGGISSRYAAWYDPNVAKQSGPVDVAVVGSPDAGSVQNDLAAAVADALRTRGVQAGDTTAAGVYDPRYRLTVLYGPAAEYVANAGRGDGNTGVCKLINSKSATALAGSTVTDGGGGTPLLAVLCWQNSFQSLAYEMLPGGGATGGQMLQARMASLVDQVFPAMNWEAYDAANQG